MLIPGTHTFEAGTMIEIDSIPAASGATVTLDAGW
jgi:hypothetical protein